MTPLAVARERGAFGVRVSLLFAAIFFVTGVYLPYMPVWLAWTGLTPREIAIVSAMPLFVRVLVTPAIAFAADRSGDHRRFLIALSWSVVAAQLLLAQMRAFWPIFLCTMLVALAWTTIMPLAETIAVRGMKAAGLDYGRMRLWGSITFILAALAGGWVVQHAHAQSVIWLLIAGSTAMAAAAHALAVPEDSERRAAQASMPRLRLADALGLLGSRTFLVFLVAAGAVQAAHAAIYTFGTLHWTALGLSTALAGVLWTVGVVAEIALFACSGAVIRRLGPIALLIAAAAAAVVRWSAMAFDPPVWLLFPLQALHGLTFGATHIAAIHFMARFVPEGQGGTAQALYATTTSGIILGGATLAAGPLYASYGGRSYLAMAVLAAAGLAAACLLRQLPQARAAMRGA